MADWISLALLVAIPVMGAAVGFFIRSKPQALKIWALLVSLASLMMLVTLSGKLAGSMTGMSLLVLLPIAAFLSLLGQSPHEENRVAWIMTLLLLGLGLGVMASRGGIRLILLVLILMLVSVLIHRYRAMSVSHPWWGIGTCGLGVVCLIVALMAAPPVSAVAFLAVCAILLPLVPFHGGYVAALAGLPGNLPAFLAFLLPGLGFHGLLTLSPGMPEAAVKTLVILGLVGALYGSLKALAQSRVRSLLAYASLSFFSILWWYVAAARTVPPQATVYLAAVGLATSGLLLAWYAIRARYGDMDLRAIRGLAHPMPRFAVLLTLLALAALGLPPFGVFSGFMGMFLTPSLPLSGALIVIVVAWLAASWYFLDLVQRLLFGRHRPELRYEDLRRAELASLLLIVMILTALGIAPPRFFESGTPIHQARAAVESIAWNK
ncbi:MAG: proton-conducting transporter membrane subunit [Nitrospiraceae bacterium]